MKKQLRKSGIILLCLVWMMGLLVGCTGNGVDQNETQNEQNTVGVEETVYPVTVKDSYDREVTLESQPERVISVAPNITEMICALGAESTLVGRTNYCDYPEQVTSIESIGTLRKPDIEKIISLEPDLVITSTHFDEENTAKLENAGISVIGLYEEYEVSGVYSMLETLGIVLNKQQQAADVIAAMQQTIQEVEEKVEGLPAPSVYYVVGYGEGGDYSAPENTFVGQLIALAGGENIVPASDSWSYSLEALLAADPEMIIVRNGEKEGFMSTAGYDALTAVKEGHVYEIDNNLLDRQGNRNAQGVLALAQIMHPEAFPNE